MHRLMFVLGLALIAPASLAGEKLGSVQITVTNALPSCTTYPTKCRIDFEIAKIEPGKVITFHKIVGRQEIGVVRSTPLQFACPCPKSYLKDTPATSFTLRAKVYDLT